MKSLVTVRKCENYEPPLLALVLKKCLDDLGGIPSLVKRGDRILLKPNLLKSAAPDEAAVTHPAVVEAIASMVIDSGAIPFIGDSPPLGNLPKVLSKCGYEP